MIDAPPKDGFAALTPEFDVTDMAKSLSFWRDLIGFRVCYSRRNGDFQYLELGKAQVMLSRASGNWQTGAFDYPLGRGINFQIWVESLEPILQRLAVANYPLFEGVQENWYRMGDEEGGNREFLVQDPDGYLLRLAEDLGRRRVT